MAEGIAQVKTALTNAETLEQMSDVMLEKLNALEHVIATQHDAVGALL